MKRWDVEFERRVAKGKKNPANLSDATSKSSILKPATRENIIPFLPTRDSDTLILRGMRIQAIDLKEY